METLIAFDPGLPREDIARLAKLLRSHKVFIPAFEVSEGDLYEPATYVIDEALHRSASVVLTDRNVFTRWVKIARSGASTEADRVAAGVMAFAHCSGWFIEPNMALYELAATRSQSAAQAEWEYFLQAEAVHVRHWADVALKRSGKLPHPLPSEDVEPLAELDTNLRKWRLHYCAVLQTAALELDQGLRPVDRFVRLLEWMHEDYLFDAAVIALALHYFSPRSPRGGILKHLRSPIRERALRGIRNATWDLSVLSQWLDLTKDPRRVVVLATLDRWLREIMKATFVYDEDVDERAHLEGMLSGLWTRKEIHVITSVYTELIGRKGDPERRKNSGHLEVDAEIQELEGEIVRWSPRR